VMAVATGDLDVGAIAERLVAGTEDR
jgi:hypothetical protein